MDGGTTMRLTRYSEILSILAFSLILMLGTGSAFAQKGKGGGGGGNKHGDGNPGKGNGNKHGGGDQGDDGGGKKHGNGGGKHAQAAPPAWQMPQAPRQVYQQVIPQQDYRAQGNGKGKWKADKGQKNNRDFERREVAAPWFGGMNPGQIRKQEVHARNAERKAYKDEEKAYKREQKAYAKAGRFDRSDYYSQPWIDRSMRTRNVYRDQSRTIYRDNNSVYRDQGRTVYRDNNYYAPQYNYDRDGYRYQAPISPVMNGYSQYSPYGYSQYGSGNYAPNIYDYSPYGYQNNNYQPTSWKQQLVRTLISSVLGRVLNRGGGYNDNDNDNDNYNGNGYLDDGMPVSYAYNQAYNQPSYYGYNQPAYGYSQPTYYGSGNYAPQYAGYAGYGSYLPAAYSAYSRPDYGYDGYSSGGGGLLGSLPIGSLLGSSRGGFVTQMLTQLLAQGYLQGLLAGGSARENGYDEDDAYYDPYVASEQGVYDPYSYTIGTNRRLMSEGYDLGFEDAVEGRNQYDPRAVQNVDLVSLLLGNVFSFS